MLQCSTASAGHEEKEGQYQDQDQHKQQEVLELLLPQPHLLRLPVELRQQIYGWLLPRENVSHPFPSVGFTSVSHRLPTSSLLRIHPQLTDEILTYYYTVTTWKVIFAHAFNFFRVDRDLSGLACSSVLPHIRNVDVVFFCDILLMKDEPGVGLGKFCEEVRCRATRVCEVLKGAERLKTVKVSWIDTMTGRWEEKASVLQPLRGLAEGRDITFTIGDIEGPGADRSAFVDAMEEALGNGRRVNADLDGTKDEGGSSKMRMLAFDIRQGRHLAGLAHK